MITSAYFKEPIFNHAVDLPGTERRSYLDQSCGGDTALRARVEALLRTHDEAGNRIAGWKAPDCPGIRRTIWLTALLALSSVAPTLDGEVSRFESSATQPAKPTTTAAGLENLFGSNSAIYEAIAQDDVERVRGLLEANPALVHSNDKIGFTPLHSALLSPTPSMAELLLAHGADINARGAGLSPVWFATMGGRPEMVALLLDRGADLRLAGTSGASLLHAVVLFADGEGMRALMLKAIPDKDRTPQLGKNIDAIVDLLHSRPAQRKAIVDLLLARRLDVNIKDDSGRTPLNLAAMTGDTAVIEVLLDHQAEIDAPDLEGFTPLNTAAESRHLAVVELLLARGASTSLPSKDGRTVLYSGAAGGNAAIVRLLLDRKADVNGRETAHRRTPLHIAALYGHDEAVELLLDHQAEVDATADDGWTPLHYAAAKRLIPDRVAWELLTKRFSGSGHKRTAELLIAHHAEINVRGRSGETPLHAAASMDNLPVVEVLLAHQAEIDPRNRHGATPLHQAAVGGFPVLVRVLLDHGAAPAAIGARKASVLHYAVEGGNAQIVDLLLERGAAPNAQDIARNTPLHFAASKGNAAMVETLLRHGATIDQPGENQCTALHYAAISGKLDVLKILLDHKANLHALEAHQATPLHVAALNRQPAAVRFLLEQQANINACDMGRQTPLHLAALNGDLAVVRILLEFHAPLEAKAKNGDTPLHFAVMVRQPGVARSNPPKASSPNPLQERIDLVKFLVDAGADRAATSAVGDTPFDVALSFGTKEIAKLVMVGAPSAKPAL